HPGRGVHRPDRLEPGRRRRRRGLASGDPALVDHRAGGGDGPPLHGSRQRDRDHRLRLGDRIGGGRLRPRLRPRRPPDRAQAARTLDRGEQGARPARTSPRAQGAGTACGQPAAARLSRHAGPDPASMNTESGELEQPVFMDSGFRRNDGMSVGGFARFVGIDWSGAKGRRHKGIAIGLAEVGGKPPRLVRPDHVWSRSEVLDWILKTKDEAPTLYGFDFSFVPPIVERGEYLPGQPGVPSTAREFWAYVEAHSDDEDLGAASFLER